MNLYLHPEDAERIRTLAAWLSAQGNRVSDSQVVKAALRCAHTNRELLEAYQSTVGSDRRYKRED